MTIDEIATSRKEMLSPNDVHEVLRCRPYTLNVTAKAGMLKIPHTFKGRNLVFPRLAFLAWYYGGGDMWQ